MSDLLLDPTDAELAAALAEAARRFRVCQFDWQTQLRRVANEAEGHAHVENLALRSSGAYVSCAWWSDYCSRKHICVAGGRLGGFPRHTSGDDSRPPLWHVCPERVYRVKRGDGEPVWLASCACGATGSPESLGWMGDRCGPCHDRREAGESSASRPLLIVLKQHGIAALGFSPAGDRLLVGVAERDLELLDLAGERCSVLYQGGRLNNDFQTRSAAFSPDGRFVAMLDPLGSYSLLVWDLSTSEVRALDDAGRGGRVSRPVFSTDGRFLAGNTADGELIVWNTSTWGLIEAARLGGVSAVAFAPDGRIAVAHRGGMSLLDPAAWDEADDFALDLAANETVRQIEFAGGSAVLLTHREEAASQPYQGRVRVWDWERRRELIRKSTRPVIAAGLSPDTRYLASVVQSNDYSTTTVLHFWDTQHYHSAGWIEWDPTDMLLRLAFSPDGETLATGSASGVVKLWPWRALLEGQRR